MAWELDVAKITKVEQIIDAYEDIKINKEALDKYATIQQINGYMKLLQEIEKEKEFLESLDAHVYYLKLKNPIRTRAEIQELKIKLLALEKSIYDELKNLRMKTEVSGNAFVQINIKTTNLQDAVIEDLYERSSDDISR